MKLNTSKKLVYVFIGTEHHNVDCIAPRVGKLLEESGVTDRVMYCDQSQINATLHDIRLMKRKYPKQYQFVAIDVGFLQSDKSFGFTDIGLKPASLVDKKQNKVIGDNGIIVNIDNCYTGTYFKKKQKLKKNVIEENTLEEVERIIELTSKELINLAKTCKQFEKK